MLFKRQLAPNGLVYLGGNSGLGVINPATNTVTYLGNWPAGFDEMIDIFFINGILHGSAYDVNNNIVLVQVNVNNPDLSTIVGPLFPTGGAVRRRKRISSRYDYDMGAKLLVRGQIIMLGEVYGCLANTRPNSQSEYCE